MQQMNSVVHFELPSNDAHRMNRFYNKVFGWKTQALGEEMGNYVLATTTETDAQGMIKNPGAINGGFYPRPADGAHLGPSLVIGVNDLQAAMRDIEANGGQLIGEPMEIPGFGTVISFTDTEGNRLSCIQPMMPMQ